MAETIFLVKGDTGPALVCTIVDSVSGAVINLVGTTANLQFRAVGSSTLQATVPGVITDGPNGVVTFFPSSTPSMLQGDAGDYEGEIQIDFPSGQTQTLYDLLKFKVREEF
tara:strand:+ start:991 stop:1323 length:333 start_codon:yes stop_codon:yes gene_type:complete